VVFNEPLFLYAFLPIVLWGYVLSPRILRNVFLLAASLAFYAIGAGKHAAVLVGAIALNYAVARWMDGASVARGRLDGATRWWTDRRVALGVGIAINAGALLFFKYTPLLAPELGRALSWMGKSPLELPEVHAPLGISFFVFQGLAYLIDVYRREIPAEREPLRFALFTAFFPQLLAGPIARYSDLAPALSARPPAMDDLARGAERFVLGLAKNVLIARPLGAVADQIFGAQVADLRAPSAWLGLTSYALQIYFDFSSYSDMAIGLGRMFGFRLRENFDYPYVSSTVTEFWRRWHISLSSWFRDYLYIPLGGNRRGPWRTYFNLFVVFAVCGLWHGANWNFLFWGLWHGALLVAERVVLARVLARVPGVVGHAYALLAVLLGWVLFRTDSLANAQGFLLALVRGSPEGLTEVSRHLTTEFCLVLCAAGIGSTPWPRVLVRRFGEWAPRWVVVPTLLVGVFGLLLLASMRVASSAHTPFIYLRF
jgi:alginate O-acetyltransferase complex protein AlgI